MVVEVTRRGEATSLAALQRLVERGRSRASARSSSSPIESPAVSCGPCSASRCDSGRLVASSIRRVRCRIAIAVLVVDLSLCAVAGGAGCLLGRAIRAGPARRAAGAHRSARNAGSGRRRSLRQDRHADDRQSGAAASSCSCVTPIPERLLAHRGGDGNACRRHPLRARAAAGAHRRCRSRCRRSPTAASRRRQASRRPSSSSATGSARSTSRWPRSWRRNAAAWRDRHRKGWPTSYVVLADEAARAGGLRVRRDACARTRPSWSTPHVDRGIEVVLLSGDRARAGAGVAPRARHRSARLRIRRPTASAAGWRASRRAGHHVAMLGDGLNDAPVIAQADVSIALAGGSMLAQTRADFIVLELAASSMCSSRWPRPTVRAASCARTSRWAFVYNVVIIPLAAFGFVSPALAAAGMAVSSLAVDRQRAACRMCATGGAARSVAAAACVVPADSAVGAAGAGDCRLLVWAVVSGQFERLDGLGRASERRTTTPVGPDDAHRDSRATSRAIAVRLISTSPIADTDDARSCRSLDLHHWRCRRVDMPPGSEPAQRSEVNKMNRSTPDRVRHCASSRFYSTGIT